MAEAAGSSSIGADVLENLLKKSDAPEQSDIFAPVAAYDEFAAFYQLYSQARSSYLRKVEDIVIAHAGNARSMIDAGAGDGMRSLRIARGVGATNVVLVEPSVGMRARCPQGLELWPCGIAEIPPDAPQFDLIVCLWNVLGHVQGPQQRLLALSKLRMLLSERAVMFLDINHRHNAAAYGWTRTLLRMAYDALAPADENGDVLVSWQVAKRKIRMRSHVFTQTEILRLFRHAGLRVIRRWVVDYEKGAERRLPVFGHLLYQLTAA